MAALSVVGSGCDSADQTTPPSTQPGSGTMQVARPGEPPTYPPLPVKGVKPRPPEPTVIASGITERGEPFEVVLYGTTRGFCMAMIFPSREKEGGGLCGDHIFIDFNGPISASGSATGTGAGLQLDGWVSPEVDSVELAYELDGEQHTLTAVTEQVPQDLLQVAGEKQPRGIFVAFVPSRLSPRDVTATALDADGAVIGSTTWVDV
jgi:hypothetical protein